MFDQQVYVQRRKSLAEEINSGIILFPGNHESSINYGHNYYPFRQDSTFLYFIGIDLPDLACLIDVDKGITILYADKPGLEEAIWTGQNHDLEQLANAAGISIIKDKKYLQPDISTALAAKRKINFLPPYRADQILAIAELLNIQASAVTALVSESLIHAVVKQRSVKTAPEIMQITEAVNITAAMQRLAMGACKPEMKESELAGKIHALATGKGVRLAFPTILTVHGEVLHIGYSNNKVRDGNILLCDCGAESPLHYSGDLTRSFPVGKKWSSVQRTIYQIVYSAHTTAIKALKPGVLFRDIHLLACTKLAEGLRDIGLMKGNIEEAVAAGAHALFFQCGVGHMLGLDTHDMENFGEQYVGYDNEIQKSTQFGLKSLRLGRRLQPGFVVTIEPGLYFNPILIDNWSAKKYLDQFINYDKVNEFRSFGGIRIEDVAHITSSGYVILGEKLPSSANEIEHARSYNGI